MDFFFEDHWRLDLGLGNPNKTAVLLALFIVAALCLARRWRGSIGWCAFLVVYLALGASLVHTYSRGGLLAAAAGLLAAWLAGTGGRLTSWRRAAAFVAVTVALGIYASLDRVSATDRYLLSPTEDRSIANRLVLWSATPGMMVDAPGGWGLGRSGEAWSQWYQSPSTRYSYRTLVNSHLTWMTEIGWIGRFFYLMLWGTILWICWPPDRSRATAGVPFGLWIAFGTGAVFSSIAEAPLLWVAPLCGLVVGVSERKRRRCWKGWKLALPALGAGSLLALMILATLGWRQARQGDLDIHHHDGITRLGRSATSTDAAVIGLFIPDPRVLGGHYGLDLRDHIVRQPEASVWLIADRPSHFGGRLTRLVLSGNTVPGVPPAGLEADSVVILNPTALPEFAAWKARRGAAPSNDPRISPRVVIGALRQDETAEAIRRSVDGAIFELVQVPGFQHYMPTWIELSLPTPNP